MFFLNAVERSSPPKDLSNTRIFFLRLLEFKIVFDLLAARNNVQLTRVGELILQPININTQEG